MILQYLTTSEEDIMKLIWEREAIYFRELMAIFPEPKPHQNTISTFLKILVEKNYLKTEKQGRIYLYRPAVEFSEYRKFVLKRFLDNYFHNSASELLKVLMNENLIQQKDLSQFLSVKSTVVPLQENMEKENPIHDFIQEITSGKKLRKKDKNKDKKKKKKS